MVARSRTAPSLRECLLFPIATPEARRDVFVGGLLLLTTLVGWILNLGHRLEVVRRLHLGDAPYFRGFRPFGHTLRRGAGAATAIALYIAPGCAVGAAAAWSGSAAPVLRVGAALLCLVAIYALPGGMTYNAAFGDLSYLYRPDRALRRAVEGGSAYLRAWGVALIAITLSFFGLLVFGVGFLFTSVWAWTVVGYAFSSALALRSAGGESPGG